MTIKRKLKEVINHAKQLIDYLIGKKIPNEPTEFQEYLEFVKGDICNWNLDTKEFLKLVERLKESLKDFSSDDDGINSDLDSLREHIDEIESGLIEADPKQRDKIVD